LGVASLLWSGLASAQATPEVRRYPPSSVRLKLIAGGVGLTGLAYGASYLCAANWNDVPGSDQLKIPVIGPWMALAKNDCAPDDPDCGFILYFRGILEVLDGVIQAGGLGVAGEGIFMTTESTSKKPEPRDAAIVVRPVPVVTGHTTGAAIVGTF
jgi:hypothetical protein